MGIRPALPNDAGRLSELAFASKAKWGYDREFMERCRPELTFEPGQLAGLRAHLLEEDGEILGFFAVRGTPPKGELADLFVAPSAMARGCSPNWRNPIRLDPGPPAPAPPP